VKSLFHILLIKKERFTSRSCGTNYAGLALNLVSPLKPLYTPGGIYHPTLPGKKRVTLTAQLNLQELLNGASSEGIATSTDYLSVRVIFGMNLLFHII
jgi:hypothetical protein